MSVINSFYFLFFLNGYHFIGSIFPFFSFAAVSRYKVSTLLLGCVHIQEFDSVIISAKMGERLFLMEKFKKYISKYSC